MTARASSLKDRQSRAGSPAGGASSLASLGGVPGGVLSTPLVPGGAPLCCSQFHMPASHSHTYAWDIVHQQGVSPAETTSCHAEQGAQSFFIKLDEQGHKHKLAGQAAADFQQWLNVAWAQMHASAPTCPEATLPAQYRCPGQACRAGNRGVGSISHQRQRPLRRVLLRPERCDWWRPAPIACFAQPVLLPQCLSRAPLLCCSPWRTCCHSAS